MSGIFNRTIADNVFIIAVAASANAVKTNKFGKMASDNPALLTGIV